MMPRAFPWRWLAALALLCLAMFADVLFTPGRRVLGLDSTDIAYQFLQWRSFGFGELASGNVALWNPHIYGGAPFFGGVQAALLYPPNWLYMILPLEAAANWTIALDVFLLGAFMLWWGARRGLHPIAAFVAAALATFCAPHFLRIASGHMTNLAAMAWVPPIFLCIDEWLRTRRRGWCLLGMAAVAMQIFAGHPQYVYFTGLVAGIYTLFRLPGVPGKLAAAAGMAAIYAGGASLAAVQLLPAIDANTETIRALPLPFQLASSFGFPPENLVTLLAPDFLGDGAAVPYWGRWLLWEASAFIGVVGLALACLGIARGRPEARTAMLVATGASTLLAFSPSTPLYAWLYDWLPLFDRFRASGKFIFFAALFLALFAGYGMDHLVREAQVPRRLLIGAGAAIAALCAMAVGVRTVDWHPVVAVPLASGQTYAKPYLYVDEAFVQAAQASASNGLLLAALLLSACLVLAWWRRTDRRAVYVVGALAVAEIFVFARLHRPTFDTENGLVQLVRSFVAQNPGDYRILNSAHPNSALVTGAYDAWGYDPGVTRRYAELLQWSQGDDPSLASQHLAFRQFNPVLSMVRLKYRVEESGGRARITPAPYAPMPRLQLVGSYRVREGRDSVFAALGEPGFDPRKEVILEREPQPAPRGSEGVARITRQGTDFIEIEADLKVASMLLVTDAWTPSWRATPLPGSSAERYEVMPANYALRAVALGPGLHRMRLEYAPASLWLGGIISLLAGIAVLATAFFSTRTRDARDA